MFIAHATTTMHFYLRDNIIQIETLNVAKIYMDKLAKAKIDENSEARKRVDKEINLKHVEQMDTLNSKLLAEANAHLIELKKQAINAQAMRWKFVENME
jgi:hypothetical protein